MGTEKVKGSDELGVPVDLTKRVTLYAPKGADFHEEGEATEVSESLVEAFISKGFSKTAPKAKESK